MEEVTKTLLKLVEQLMRVHLSDEPDTFTWHLMPSQIFSEKSLYADLMNDHARFLSKYIWCLKVPLKIRIFMWLLNKKMFLVKDNLSKRN
jgi:hypothetical protein